MSPGAEIGMILSAPFVPTHIASDAEPVLLKTEYGDVSCTVNSWEGRRVAFLRRGTPGSITPAHRVRYRALIAACIELGVERIVSTAVVGSLRPDLLPGTMLVLDQFLDFTKQRPLTAFDGDEYAHVDMTEPYCPDLREAFLDAARANAIPVEASGCYVGVE